MASLSAASSGLDVRLACRAGLHASPTAGLAAGRAQANLVLLPRAAAADFAAFCAANPAACPVLEVVERGFAAPGTAPAGCDVRTDAPLYRVFRHGALAEEARDVAALVPDDGSWCAFLIGCSFSFEDALLAAGLPVRHVEAGVNVPMYTTNRQTAPAGPFAGPLVVSMRPMTPAQAARAAAVTAAFPRVHGAPVHVGDAAELGIADLARPDYGDAVEVREGEVPVFWACGVTPQAALLAARLPLAITHAPGHMLVLDVTNAELAAPPGPAAP